MSKSVQLVIDVNGEKTKDGIPLIGWSRHGKSNKKWQIVEGRIHSCSGDDLNAIALKFHSLAVWSAADYLQKWTFVPEECGIRTSFALTIPTF